MVGGTRGQPLKPHLRPTRLRSLFLGSFFSYSVMNYPYSIPSVTQIHPVLDNNPNVNNLLQGAHASNLIGTPIDSRAVIKAEGTVEVLSGVKSGCSLLRVYN